MKNSKPNIAMVDDEMDVCSVLVKLIRRRDIPVSFVAYDGPGALLKFKSADPKPDIVILDYRLQYAKGVDVMREMLMIQSSTKVIFLSAEVGVMREAYDAGAVLFLVKPVSIKTISDAIDVVHNNQGKYNYNGFKFVKSEV
jgi:FixJ family two-component response regulator